MKAHFFPGIATAVLAAALLAATAAAQAGIIPAAELRGKRILLVTGQPDPDRPADDAAVKAHLESLGCVVTGALDSDPASRSQGQDLVVISASVNAHVLQGTYRDSALPVFTWSGESYPNLAMTGPRRHVDFEIVDTKIFYAQSFTNLYGLCVNATNPIARDVGLPAQLFGTLYLEPEETCWGRPGFGAQVVSVFEGDPDKAGLFTYEQGATLADGSAAPARRVGFFLGRDNFHMLTDCHGPAERDPDEKAWYVGLKLFDASLRWALSPPPPPPGSDHAELHAQLARAARGKKVLFVERIESPEGKEADEHDVAYLRALGFTVTVADQTDLARPAGQDLIVISATCSKYKLTNKYSDAGIPIMCHEGLYADVLHLTGRHRYTEYGEHGEDKESDDPEENYLDIVGAWHPLAAGLHSGLVQTNKTPGTLKWGLPTRGAIVIATLPNAPEQCAIFGYEKGATMAYDHIAPARRLLFPLDNDAFDDLTDDGLALYDAAVLWSISPPNE